MTTESQFRKISEELDILLLEVSHEIPVQTHQLFGDYDSFLSYMGRYEKGWFDWEGYGSVVEKIYNEDFDMGLIR